MIDINPGDLNLQPLAGNAALMVHGSDLPNELYVFGIGRAEFDYYIDPTIPQVHDLVEFLKGEGYNVYADMPFHPKKRPAVGIQRSVRAEKIEDATDLCIIVLMFINGRLSL